MRVMSYEENEERKVKGNKVSKVLLYMITYCIIGRPRFRECMQ